MSLTAATWRIQKFTGTGEFIIAWGSQGAGEGQYETPFGICFEPASTLLVAAAANNRNQRFTTDGGFVTEWGTAGAGPGQFNHPTCVATDAAGDIYVMDNARIQKFSNLATATQRTSWGHIKAIFRQAFEIHGGRTC